jgi:hypothetical protein
MHYLIHALLSPFASAAAGAIIGILLATLGLGISDDTFVKLFALVGAIIGVASSLAPIFVGLLSTYRAEHLKQLEYARGTIDKSEVNLANKLVASEQEAKMKLLAAEHEARQPICSHCRKRTSPVFRHRKKSGGPDGRYHDNPLLCNKCFNPYAGVRPWNLPGKAQD